MDAEQINQLKQARYLNLTTYRKNGTPVSTPVWFVEDNGLIYIYTLATAGKIKRIRNNSRVRLVPSDARGRPQGSWIDGEAKILKDADARKADQLLDRKYGWQRKLLNLFRKFSKTERAFIAIHV